MCAKVYIGFGSNQGDLIHNLEAARTRIQKIPCVLASLQQSRLYRTEPLTLDHIPQPWYLNAVFAIETTLTPHQLFAELRKIEKDMGRVSQKKWVARIVDLDILFYNDLIYSDQDLCVPHREICKRLFVLRPLCDLAPGLVHPEMLMTMAELLEICSSKLAVHVLEDRSIETGT